MDTWRHINTNHHSDNWWQINYIKSSPTVILMTGNRIYYEFQTKNDAKTLHYNDILKRHFSSIFYNFLMTPPLAFVFHLLIFAKIFEFDKPEEVMCKGALEFDRLDLWLCPLFLLFLSVFTFLSFFGLSAVASSSSSESSSSWKLIMDDLHFFGRMLKAPPLKSSGLYISGLHDRPNIGVLHMFLNMFEKVWK